jgi:hypothetical protein
MNIQNINQTKTNCWSIHQKYIPLTSNDDPRIRINQSKREQKHTFGDQENQSWD